jgi:hypothetical protein
MLYPETRRKAQAEIDRVIGNDRLPTLADQPNLPYTDALVKEVFRWNPVVPLGKSAVFQGYGSPFVLREANHGESTRTPAHLHRRRRLRGEFYPQGVHGNRERLVSEGQNGETSSIFRHCRDEVLNLNHPPLRQTGKFCTTQPLTPIRWNLTLIGSWEIILSQTLVRRPLGLGEESVRAADSL